nr:ATP-binding protein [Pseudomonadota bacterium]
MTAAITENPFPGLRPFEPHESFLYFGRDDQIDELLARLEQTRFLAVVGTSGGGKSSLIRAGLLPALQRGYMTGAGSRWRVALFRPGDDPIGGLAKALDQPRETLDRSSLGLVEATKDLRLDRRENLLVVVDQFEELFRFHKLAVARDGEDEAAAFVKLLLRASEQSEVPSYVVLTMRSDYLGDCAQFRGLPEALNSGQYLVPRMTRDQQCEAIEDPVAVGGAEITPRLVQRLLNDVGDDPDQLPILQHALMRTWELSGVARSQGQPIDLEHYEATGTTAEALNRHADEAFEELRDELGGQEIARKLFQRLTEKGADKRETRQPTSLRELCAVTEADEAHV